MNPSARTLPFVRRMLFSAAALLLGVLILVAPLGAQRTTVSVTPRREVVQADDGHRLTVWSRRPPGAVRGSILLLHGRTWSSLPNFDLQVAGQHLSMMDAIVARGYAVYALDQRGYGATPRDSSQWLTPSRAARDAVEVLEWISKHERGPKRPVLFGYSQGSLTAMLAAQRSASSMSAVVLYGFPLDLADSAGLIAARGAAPRVLARRRTTLTGAEEDFITPESTPPGVKAAYARAAVAADPIRSDWRDEAEFLALDAAALHVPVLVINGERDPYAGAAKLQGFMARVSGVDRSWVVLAKADHAAHLERQGAFVDALIAFIARR